MRGDTTGTGPFSSDSVRAISHGADEVGHRCGAQEARVGVAVGGRQVVDEDSPAVSVDDQVVKDPQHPHVARPHSHDDRAFESARLDSVTVVRVGAERSRSGARSA